MNQKRPQKLRKKTVRKQKRLSMHSLLGDVKFGENGKLVIRVDGNVAHLDKQIGNVESENEGLKEMVRVAFQRIQNAVKPISLSVS